MIKVYSDVFQTREYTKDSEPPEYALIVAAYSDDFEKLKKVVQENSKTIDVNAVVMHSPTRGNGTALILTGKKEIASFLLQNGAQINRVYDTGTIKITALDSALAELKKNSAKKSTDKYREIEDLIEFFKNNGAKLFKELNYEN